jgi:hypothetical protein
MPQAYWNTQLQRTKVLGLARDLARSGQHENHHGILAELEAVEGFATAHRCLTDRVISAQLDRLCAIAQASAPAGAPDLAGFLAKTRQAARENVVRSPR